MPEPDSNTAKPPRTRLFALCGLLLLSVFGADELRFRVQLHQSVSGTEPDEDFLEEVKANPQRLDRVLAALWDANRIAHRQAVLHLIKFPGTSEQRFSPIQRFERYLLEGAASRDIAVRTAALQLLVQHDHPRWQGIVAGQFQDPDSHIRVLAMRLLRQRGVTNALPLVSAQLDHPDPNVACNAVVWLQDATGLDHGMKTRWISNRVLLSDEERAANRGRYEASLAKAKSWWKQAKENSPRYTGPMEAIPEPAILPTPSPQLVDFEHKPFALDSFKGRPTLYYFFTVWKSSPFSEAEGLNALHDIAGDRVRILGVALDAIPDEHNANQHADLIPDEGLAHHDHGHDHHHQHEPEIEFDVIAKRVKERSTQHGYKFPIAMDVTGHFTDELQAGAVPCFVLVDEEHRVIRRFAQGRSAQTFLAMLGQP